MWLVIDLAVGIAGGRVRALVTANSAFARAIGWIPGCIYLGLATRLALETRR